MNFYNAVWVLAKRRGERIADVARSMGVSRQCIDAQRNAKGIRVETAKKYADYFGVTLDEFFEVARRHDG